MDKISECTLEIYQNYRREIEVIFLNAKMKFKISKRAIFRSRNSNYYSNNVEITKTYLLITSILSAITLSLKFLIQKLIYDRLNSMC